MTLKSALRYIVAPLVLLFAFISYLLSRITTLKSQVNQAKLGRELDKTLDELKDAKEDADAKEQEFNSAYSDYERAKRDNGEG